MSNTPLTDAEIPRQAGGGRVRYTAPRTPSPYETSIKLGQEVDLVRHENALLRADHARLQAELDALREKVLGWAFLMDKYLPADVDLHHVIRQMREAVSG